MFAVVALVISALGLVAVIAHSVTQRTKEIGVRMAVGAATRDIARMIVREGMRPVTIGLLAGFAAAAATNRILESQLVGVSPYDPLTMIAGPLVLIAVALIGCRIPARRAMRVDPSPQTRVSGCLVRILHFSSAGFGRSKLHAFNFSARAASSAVSRHC